MIKAKAALSYPSQFFEVSKPKTLASFDRSPTNARTHREEQDNGTSNRITSRPKYHILLFDFRLSGIKGVQARRHRPPFQRSTANFNQCARFVLLSRAIELELELIQSHMAQKPVLRGEVGCACVAREVSVERGISVYRGGGSIPYSHFACLSVCLCVVFQTAFLYIEGIQTYIEGT